jgi:hypothetical protein
MEVRQPKYGWRRERVSNWRYTRSARGDSVAVPNKQEAARRAALVAGPADHIVGSRRPAPSQKTRLKNRFSSVFSNGFSR